MTRVLRAFGVPSAALFAALLIPVAAAAQNGAPAAEAAPVSRSAEPVQELVTLLQEKNLTSFAVKDPDDRGRFVAVLHIPGVQLMVVAARYQRASDIDYRIYHKEYMTAYRDLNASTLASEKVFIEDTAANGLVLVPAEGAAGDLVRAGDLEQVFDGDFADPRKRNDKRVPQTEYYKTFSDADAQYTRLLGLMLAELKKSVP
jgi:hypothetical protein